MMRYEQVKQFVRAHRLEMIKPLTSVGDNVGESVGDSVGDRVLSPIDSRKSKMWYFVNECQYYLNVD